MLIEIALYLLIGFTGLLFFKSISSKDFLQNLLIVLFWPYYFLLRYVELVDNTKRNGRR